MATVQPQTVHAIAESVAVGRLSDDAAKALAPHVDVRLREIVQARADLQSSQRYMFAPLLRPQLTV